MGNNGSSPIQAAKALISGSRQSPQQAAKVSGSQQAKAMVPTLATPSVVGGGRKRSSKKSPKRSSKKSPKRKISKSRSMYSKLKRFVGLRGGARKRSTKRKVTKSKMMKGKNCQRGGC
jgi:uncharacterized protein (DUF2252 family)